MALYRALRDELARVAHRNVLMTFSEIEKVVGKPLPASSRDPGLPWWENDGYHTQSINGWRAAGYKVVDVNYSRHEVTFGRC